MEGEKGREIVKNVGRKWDEEKESEKGTKGEKFKGDRDMGKQDYRWTGGKIRRAGGWEGLIDSTVKDMGHVGWLCVT